MELKDFGDSRLSRNNCSCNHIIVTTQSHDTDDM